MNAKVDLGETCSSLRKHQFKHRIDAKSRKAMIEALAILIRAMTPEQEAAFWEDVRQETIVNRNPDPL